jgi:hypothetical protein
MLCVVVTVITAKAYDTTMAEGHPKRTSGHLVVPVLHRPAELWTRRDSEHLQFERAHAHAHRTLSDLATAPKRASEAVKCAV